MDLNKFTEKSSRSDNGGSKHRSPKRASGSGFSAICYWRLNKRTGLFQICLKRRVCLFRLRKPDFKTNWINFRVSGTSPSVEGVYITQRLKQILVRAIDESKNWRTNTFSVEHIVLINVGWVSPITGVGRVFKAIGLSRDAFLKVLTRSQGKPTCNKRQSRSNLWGVGKIWSRFNPSCPAKQTWPGDWEGQRNPQMRSSPFSQDKEQSSAYWWTRCRKNSNCRGACKTYCLWRCAGCF